MNPFKFLLSALRFAGVFGLHIGDDSPGGASQTQVTDLPDWAKPYAKQLLGKGAALSETPYQTYSGQRQAGFTPLQQQSFQTAAGMQPSQLGAQAGQFAGAATLGALGTTYDPYQMGQFTSQAAGQYMNPYLEQAMAPQLREAARASEIQRNQAQAQAVGQGAFGGSRQAIVEAERQRNLAQQQGDIRARGYQTAFDQAQQQFAREQQLREQSRQFGAGLGLQGLQTALQGAGQMGQLGGQQFAQAMDINKLQNLYGGQQQAQEQAGLTQQYQDFLNQQRYPYQQLEFMSNLLRGTPMGTVQTLYGGQGNTMGQLLGTGLGVYGMMNRAEGGMVDSYAEGGVTDVNNIEDILSKLSDQQLQQAQEAAAARGDAMQMQMITAEMAQRASMRRGIAAGIPEDFADSMEEGMASGGIVAFADGGDIDPLSMIGGNVSPEAMAMDEARRQSILASRKEAEDRERLEFLKTAAPEVAARLEAGKKKPDDAPAAPKANETVKEAVKETPAPKATKQISKAVKEVAQSAGVPEKSIADEAMDIYNRMQGLHKTERDELNKLIEAQKGKGEEIKARGLSDALMNFGFAMAAKASKPGATLLGSIGEAAPTLGTTMAENRKLADAAEDNYNKLLTEQKKYELALKRGDMQQAETSANNIAQRRMDQKRLDQQISYQNRSLGIQAAGRQSSISQLAGEIMSDPTFKGTKMDALRQASGLIGGVDIRTAAAAQNKYLDAVSKDSGLKLLNFQLQQAKTDEERAKITANINARKAALAADAGVSGTGSGQVDMRFDAKGNLIQ